MNKLIRGIECVLDDESIGNFLPFISKKSAEYVVPWCMVSTGIYDMNNGCDAPVSREWLNELAQETILELVLFVYPPNASKKHIETYTDFKESDCCLCLIYYDCGTLEMYIKDPADFHDIWHELKVLNAQEMVEKTDCNDNRIVLHL